MNFCAHEIGPDGIERVGCGPLRFRSQDELTTMLKEAGLVVDRAFGGFNGEPVGQGIGILAFIARRP